MTSSMTSYHVTMLLHPPCHLNNFTQVWLSESLPFQRYEFFYVYHISGTGSPGPYFCRFVWNRVAKWSIFCSGTGSGSQRLQRHTPTQKFPENFPFPGFSYPEEIASGSLTEKACLRGIFNCRKPVVRDLRRHLGLSDHGDAPPRV